MKFLAGILVVLLACAALASEKITAVVVDGVYYRKIQDVHVTTGGRIVILLESGGTTVAADKLPAGFLASWGITPEEVAASKAAAEKMAEQSLAQAVHAGVFREVDGVVYDLRKPQPAWRKFSNAKILQVIEGGALVDPAPLQASSPAILVRNLQGYADNDKASFMAKVSADFSFINKFGFEHTIHAYDMGRICERNEIPEVIANGTQASARFASATRPGETERPAQSLPGEEGLRGIGSGFFITGDGYLLTNFHVVREARRLRAKYKNDYLDARVVQVDAVNDLALVKVTGKDFPTLPISRKDSADLGDAVFTLGYPNIDMQGMAPKFTDGKISSLAGMRDDPSEYQISVPVQPGNSGGPLCDADGNVVGIVVARLNDMTALRESGAVPQNVNYAVKAKYALQLLHSVKGIDNLPAIAKAAHPIQAAEDASVMILIY